MTLIENKNVHKRLPSIPSSQVYDGLRNEHFYLDLLLIFTFFLKRFIQGRDKPYISRILREYCNHGGLHKFILNVSTF